MSEIKLIQIPIIEHKLIEVGTAVTNRLAALDIEKQIATEQTVKTLKDLRAELNKELAEFEDQRKGIKSKILNPYDEFESVYKTQISTKYTDAINLLKDKISFVETAIKNQKKESLIAYFAEFIASEKIDFITFGHLGLEVNLSTTEKEYKTRINDFVNRVKGEIQLIENSEFPIDSMVEYRKSLNVAASITNVKQRKEAEKIEIERQKQARKVARIRNIQYLGLLWDEFTQSFKFNDSICISRTDVENLENNDFNTKFVEIENLIKAEKSKAIETEILQEPEIVEPVYVAPITEEQKPKEVELFTATFEVTAPMEKLQLLKKFLIENSINYKNV